MKMGEQSREEAGRRIDKSWILEQRLQEFPILYVEAAAAAGKTTALGLLLNRHPGQKRVWLDMGRECRTPAQLQKRLSGLILQIREEPLWILCDSMPAQLPVELLPTMQELLETVESIVTAENRRVLFLGREKPEEWLLPFLWKEKLGMVSHQDLLLTREEVEQMAAFYGRAQEAEALWNLSGGWAGCVSMALRLTARPELAEASLTYIWQTYEMEAYIRREIIGSLTETEAGILELAACCPWVNEALCRDTLERNPRESKNISQSVRLNKSQSEDQNQNRSQSKNLLEDLTRKGFLQCDFVKRQWKLAPLFRLYRGEGDDKGSGDGGGTPDRTPDRTSEAYYEAGGEWYQAHGYVREALDCLSKREEEEDYRSCLLRHYKRIPFLGVDYSTVLTWQEESPELHYLKGMWYRSVQDFKGMDREIAWLQKQVLEPAQTSDMGHRRREVLLNLTFASPGVSLEEWLSLAENLSQAERQYQAACHSQAERQSQGMCLSQQPEERHSYELYSIMGNSFTFLCGLRDLTGLFACGKREEKRMAQIWRNCLGQREELAYRLARMDYLLETEQIQALTEEDRKLLEEVSKGTTEGPTERTTEGTTGGTTKEAEGDSKDGAFSLMCLYLTCKLQQRKVWSDNRERAQALEEKLRSCDRDIYRENARALAGLYAPYFGETGKLADWIRSLDVHRKVTEASYGQVFLECVGFIKYQRPENIRKLLEDLITHLQAFHYQRLLAEALFLQALLAHEEGSGGRSAMLKAVIQAFLVGGSGHYIRFYTSYGSKGKELLETYREWSRSTSPERWKRKKKYHYASPAQMPEEDYLDLLIRQAGRHRQAESRMAAEEMQIPEKLTTMETVVLQAMSRGLSNAEICAELSLKLPTVKSHIYSIYKKLGVNSRVQAILRGKERGILQG